MAAIKCGGVWFIAAGYGYLGAGGVSELRLIWGGSQGC